MVYDPRGVVSSSARPTVGSDIAIYPNPASDFVEIRSTGVFSDLTISIYDVNGRQVYSACCVSLASGHSIEVSGLISGKYSVVMNDGSEVIYSSPLIITR